MKKISVKQTSRNFIGSVDEVIEFIEKTTPSSSKKYDSWIYDYAIIRLYREFENLILQALIGAVNNNTTTISTTMDLKFPKHLNREVCRYLIIKNGYFDFKGRDGLIGIIKSFVPDHHYLHIIITHGSRNLKKRKTDIERRESDGNRRDRHRESR